MVTLVNRFTVFGEPDEFERIWKSSSDFMRRQPGFISFRLVRSITDPKTYINIAEWADAESHRRVTGGPDFGKHIAELRALSHPDPNLCEMVIEYAADR